jgi:hypothetical protein
MSTHTDPDRLDMLALRAGADIRLPLLRTLVDLYLQKPTHTAEEAQHFTELALRLFDQADVATRLAMARRLAPYPSVPEAIMQRLANDVPDVAALVRATGRGSTPEPEVAAPERVAPGELSELFFAATAAERRMILINLAYAPRLPAPAPAGNLREAARELEMAALAHNPEAFMRALERSLGITPALARRIVRDALGEPIVVAAKTLGMASDALQRILLFLNPAVGRSVYRVYELAMLFETIDAAAAHTLVAIWRAAEPRPSARPAQDPREPAGRVMRRGSPTATTAKPRDPVPVGPGVGGGKR